MSTGATTEKDAFGASRECFETVVGFLQRPEAGVLTHAELETRLGAVVRAVVRQLYQDHIDLRACHEERLDNLSSATGARHRSVEADHDRPLSTIFGEVTVSRLAYRRRGEKNLYPADAALNLPAETHSHGLRELCAIESARGSFEEAGEAGERATAVHIAKRQVEQLTRRAAVDFEAFYSQSSRPEANKGDVLVLSADGKGIVMRPGELRQATALAAAKASPKLKTRLSKGEKKNSKRMAELGTVYDATPVVRAATDILADGEHERPPAPEAKGKWLTASVVEDIASVIAQVFDEAERRDPNHLRSWVALVDGARHQIDCIKAEAKRRRVSVTIVCDVVHVLEYIWSATWSFYREGDAEAEAWVKQKALGVLEKGASTVAAAICRKATCLGLDASRRANADKCADYLLAKAPYLDQPAALASGWPIATGVIEGACRHIVADRMDLTGARWGLEGAEAVLKLRALRSNGDFSTYWGFHLAREQQRVHEARYANGALPRAA